MTTGKWLTNSKKLLKEIPEHQRSKRLDLEDLKSFNSSYNKIGTIRLSIMRVTGVKRE